MSQQATMSVLDRYYTHALHGFLPQYAVQARQGQEASLCGMGSLKGRWLIPDEKYPEFFDLLDDYLNKEKARPLNLVEQPRLDQAKPLLIDLDFKFPVDSALAHRFSKEHTRKFIRFVSEGLNTFFDTEVYQSIRFFVSLRPQAYSAGKVVKDGIHIQSPDITLTNEKQKVLRTWLLEKEAIQNSFGGIGYINEIQDIYDESMVRKQGWFLYGESKPNISPYQLNTVFAYNPEADALDEENLSDFTPRQLLELLSVRYEVAVDDNDVKEEAQPLFEKYLSSRPPAVANGGAKQHEEPAEAVAAPTPGILGVYIPDKHDVEEIELAKRIALECLSEERADAYKTWIEVGWCLYNIDPSEEMFQTFVEFSKKSPKSDGTDWGKLQRDWMRGFSRNTAGAKLTLKSLHYWARDDNLQMYKDLIEEDHVRFAQYRISDTHFHVAKLLQRMYKGNFCASVESRRTEWFVFDERIHTWRHTNQGMELQEKLSTEVADLIIRARERLKKAGREASMANNGGNDDPDWFKKWSGTPDGERFMMLVKLEKHLYQQDFKGGVMRAAIELFHEEDFANRLNVNPYLFACKNGVLDLNNQVRSEDGSTKTVVVFRAGRPDDYISQLAGRNYPDSEAIEYIPYDPENPQLSELMEFLLKIFPNKELRNYYIRLMASCLEGNNREQCYYTFIGVGGNGKSKVVDLMRYTFGDYCSSLQATALTRKRPDSGAANPDIIAIKNKRFIYLQEPDDKEPLNTSRMKQFSGEDVVEARGLFEDQQRFRITGKLFMMCNSLPPIHSMDRGTWRRIRVLKFGSKFVDQSDPELKNGKPGVYLRDNGLDAKLREWREVWLGLLVHIYETEYIKNGLEPIPAEVISESNKYKESFDQYGKFKAERMIDFRDPRLGLEEHGDEQVTLKDVSMAYTNWTRQNEGTLTGKKLTKQELQKRLEEDFGNLDGGVYKRCMVFFDEEGKTEEEERRRS
jgi:P4 family phage/plasmid primase-like protien